MVEINNSKILKSILKVLLTFCHKRTIPSLAHPFPFEYGAKQNLAKTLFDSGNHSVDRKIRLEKEKKSRV